MPVVDFELTMAGSVDECWQYLTGIEAFPTIASDVRSVRILTESGDRRVSEWAVVLLGSELRWTEEELIDERAHRIDFRQITGDLDYFEGFWQLNESQADGVAARFFVDFDTGVPQFADTLDPVATLALRDNFKRIVAAFDSIKGA